MRHRPEEQQYRCGTQKSRHAVYGQSGVRCAAAEERDHEARGKHEDRVARRVTDFEFESLKNEFRAVPEACRGLYGEQIGHGGYDEA